MLTITPATFNSVARYEDWIRETFKEKSVLIKWHELLADLPQTESFDPELLAWEAYQLCNKTAAETSIRMNDECVFDSGDLTF